MTFGQSVKTCFTKYVGFQGLASRSEYWWWFLFEAVIYAASGVILASDPSPGLGALSGLIVLALILPSLAVSVRRLRDAGFSPWLILIGIIPYLGGLVLIILATRPSKFSGGIPGNFGEINVLANGPEGNFCSACGKMRLPGQKFCQGCGASF